MHCNWLKGPRDAAGVTQDAVAAALGVNVKTIQRLEGCSADTPLQVRYADLARALSTAHQRLCPIQLAEAHARDLDAAGRTDHAGRARASADRLRRDQHFPRVAPAPIEVALAACAGLVARLAQSQPSLPDAQTQAQHLARLLSEGNLDDVNRLLWQPLQDAIADATDEETLKALGLLVRAVLCGCVALDQALAQPIPGQGWLYHGETRAWPYAAMIDRACRLDGLRHLTLEQPRPAATAGAGAPRNRRPIDDGSIRAVRSPANTGVDPARRVYEWVYLFAQAVAYPEDPPDPQNPDAFASYCDGVDGYLWALNAGHDYVFGLWERARCEPAAVKDELLRRLGNLRLFDTGEPKRANPVFGVAPHKASAWLEIGLNAIEDRRAALAATARQPTPPAHPATPTEQTPMPQTDDKDRIVLYNQGNGPIHLGTGHIQQANDQAQQYNQTAAPADLLPLLRELLDATRTAEPRYTNLRQACRDAEGELERTGTLSAPVRTFLQRTIDALPTVDSAFNVGQRVAEWLARVGFGV